MSHDGVKFVTQIENHFGVSISDDEVGRIETIGELTDYLSSQALDVYRRPCVAAWLFYRLRRVLLNELPLGKHAVRPGSRLDRLIPSSARKRLWGELQAEFGYRLPPLQWPDWVRYGLLAFAAISLVVIVGGTIAAGALQYLFVLPFIWALIVWVVMMLAKLYTRHIPEEVATMADAVRQLTPFQGLPYDRPPEAIEPWVYEQVCQVASETLGMQAEELQRETHFIHDLGLK